MYWKCFNDFFHRSWMSDRHSVVNIARRVDLQSRHSYPFSLLIISGRISLKQRNEQVDYRYMFYLLMTLFSWNMARQQHVKCNWLGGELGGRWHDSDQCCGQFFSHKMSRAAMAPPSGERVATLQKNISQVYRKYSIQFISTFGRNIKLWLHELGHIAIFW